MELYTGGNLSKNVLLQELPQEKDWLWISSRPNGLKKVPDVQNILIRKLFKVVQHRSFPPNTMFFLYSVSLP